MKLIKRLVSRIVPLAALGLTWAAEARAASPHPDGFVSHFLSRVSTFGVNESMLDPASKLFVALATMSLVWTMSVHVVRHDFGEMFMEVVRFMVVTGTFYWLLLNASGDFGTDSGFVHRIIDTFFELPMGTSGKATMLKNANSLLGHGLNIFLGTLNDVGDGSGPDQMVSLGLAAVILMLLAFLAAQFLLALVMTWMLAYAGIFLLGFGGARWTAPIAISYYKHVVALGAAIIALSIIGSAGSTALGMIEPAVSPQSVGQFVHLAEMLASCILLVVLGVRVPQLMYTLVSGSHVGMFASVAVVAGHAFASGGAAISGALNRPSGGGLSRSGAGAVMAAVNRGGAAAGDPFHVGSGADPFGVPRRADPYRHGTAFGASTSTVTPLDDRVRTVTMKVDERDSAPGVGASSPDVSRGRPNYDEELAQAAESRRDAPAAASGPATERMTDDEVPPP